MSVPVAVGCRKGLTQRGIFLFFRGDIVFGWIICAPARASSSAFWCTDPIIADNSFEKYFNLTGEFSDKYKYRYHEILFTTDDFSSWPYKLDVILPNNLTAANDPLDEAIGVRLNIGMYANDYYSYLRSKYDNDHNQNMFAEPAQLYSNIENGVGFFGIKKEFKLEFWLKR